MDIEQFKGIQINKIQPVILNDIRGLTYEWCKGIPGLQIVVYTRYPGYLSGDHYHKGQDPSKNPERFLLLDGKATLKARNPENQILEEIIGPFTELLIHPNILHTIMPLEEIIFIEYRSTTFNPENSDVYPASTYKDYIDSLASNPFQPQSHFSSLK